MSFVSPEYILFFCIVVPLYFLTPARFRWLYLLGVSYYFYAYWNVWFLPIIVFTTLFNYSIALTIDRTTTQPRKKQYLILSIVVNVGLLFVFKYFNFFTGAVAGLLNGLSIPVNIGVLNVVLPIGISFYTFQVISYCVDVYRGILKPERHLGIFALFVSFFPQLVAGPIERGGRMLPQYHQTHDFDEGRTIEGLRLILWGFFKKIVIADRLAIYVDAVYNNTGQYSGIPLILATVFFAFQIYCDFSAYTDIAIGTAKVLGIRLAENFRQPYFSRSVLEFWRRWHISLTTWIREYLFFPLSRTLLIRTNRRNPRLVEVTVYLIVMLIVGLWHGAAWTFILWGLIHGIYMGVETIFNNWRIRVLPERLHPTISSAIHLTVTFALVCFAWIFFRANTVNDGFYVISHLFVFPDRPFENLAVPFTSDLTGAFGADARIQFLLAWVLIGLLIFVDFIDSRWGVNTALNSIPKPMRWVVYYAATAMVLLIGIWGAQEFIYFQF